MTNETPNYPVAVQYLLGKSASRIYEIAEEKGILHPEYKELQSICDDIRLVEKTLFNGEN